ncbi:MAG: isoprenylcysteine carboxylmethyltransferase family protein [Desulfobacterales bacterium]|nr:isoprenylcysteine carboxylmethyltransferase family protein [Desulfobacterales bacterium]
MNRIITFPPFYFFSAILMAPFFILFFPSWTMIRFPSTLIGLPVMGAGLYLLQRSSGIFNERRTTFYLAPPDVFVREDVYRFSRNPMYLGALIFILGLCALTGNLLSFACPVLFFVSINFFCIPPEETLMEQTFGNEYLAYRSQVRRWI